MKFHIFENHLKSFKKLTIGKYSVSNFLIGSVSFRREKFIFVYQKFKNMEIFSDFHIHSRYSTGTSWRMTLDNIAHTCKLKGIDLIGTGDCLHLNWLNEIKQELKLCQGLFIHDTGTMFILTSEVEDINRVHHLLILPNVEACYYLRKKLESRIKEDTGRMVVNINAGELADLVFSVGGLIGPAHAFTPWTSLYKEFESISECYRDLTPKISFLELGLSADTEMADSLPELAYLPYLSNSDSHSLYSIGREFNRLKIYELSFDEISKAIKFESGRKILENVGLDPRKGKYHLTACCKCFRKVKPPFSRFCLCGGRIKLGVWDRIQMLSRVKVYPKRPKYIKICPLPEIIQKTYNWGNSRDHRVFQIWKRFVNKFNNEIAVLLEVDIQELQTIDKNVAYTIKLFRENKINIIPGGGGQYGELEIPKKTQFITLDTFFKTNEKSINGVVG